MQSSFFLSTTLVSLLIVALGPNSVARAAADAHPPASDLTSSYQRNYNATAVVSVFGIRIFSRNGVGGGRAHLDESGAAAKRHVHLEFVAGSQPERAHGLNRMGYIEESVEEFNAQLQNAAYFGFITANSEESLAQAKAALNNNDKKEAQVPYTAARGEVSQTSARYNVCHLLMPSSLRWTAALAASKEIRTNFKTAGQDKSLTLDQPLDTFLYAVVSAIRSDAKNGQVKFLHNGKLFQLITEKRDDPKTGIHFIEAGLASSSQQIQQLSGIILNLSTNSKTSFHLWFNHQDANPLPLRFEFDPKSYLKLSFEALPVAKLVSQSK